MSRKRSLAVIIVVVGVLFYAFRFHLLNAYHEHTGGCAIGSFPAVAVKASDARTGAPLPDAVAEPASLIVRDGAYADTAPLLFGGALDRMGSYDVVVRAPGYREWRATRIRPARRVCRIQTAVVHARLQRL
ncbi:MAG TPA: hypothetical protein VE913_09260 [Longimicrobium sp.]|nr:hypothetical protein [Longimicrobium sp.]